MKGTINMITNDYFENRIQAATYELVVRGIDLTGAANATYNEDEKIATIILAWSLEEIKNRFEGGEPIADTEHDLAEAAEHINGEHAMHVADDLKDLFREACRVHEVKGWEVEIKFEAVTPKRVCLALHG